MRHTQGSFAKKPSTTYIYGRILECVRAGSSQPKVREMTQLQVEAQRSRRDREFYHRQRLQDEEIDDHEDDMEEDLEPYQYEPHPETWAK